jgi:hypothetical protein
VTPESRRLAGILLVLLPTVVIGGVSILTLLIRDPAYQANPLRQDLWRARHAHAGVMLPLSLVRGADDRPSGPGLSELAHHTAERGGRFTRAWFFGRFAPSLMTSPRLGCP